MSKFNFDAKLGPALNELRKYQASVKRENQSKEEINSQLKGDVLGLPLVIKIEDVKPFERNQFAEMVIEPQNAARRLRMKRRLEGGPQKEIAASSINSARPTLIKKMKIEPTPEARGTWFSKPFNIKAEESTILQSAQKVQLPKKDAHLIEDHNYALVKFEVKTEPPDQEATWIPDREALIQTIEETVETCEEDATEPAQKEEVIVISSQDEMKPKPVKEVLAISDDCYVVQPIKDENETDQVIEISSESESESLTNDSWEEQGYSSDTTDSSSEPTDDSYYDDDDDQEPSETSDTSEEDEPPPPTVKKGKIHGCQITKHTPSICV